MQLLIFEVADVNIQGVLFKTSVFSPAQLSFSKSQDLKHKLIFLTSFFNNNLSLDYTFHREVCFIEKGPFVRSYEKE